MRTSFLEVAIRIGCHGFGPAPSNGPAATECPHSWRDRFLDTGPLPILLDKLRLALALTGRSQGLRFGLGMTGNGPPGSFRLG
jgi:hypothetical protein